MLGARGNPRAEAYIEVCRSERVERNNADGPFSASLLRGKYETKYFCFAAIGIQHIFPVLPLDFVEKL
jgi:hypothetical protein